MAENVLSVLTYKSVSTILADGGTQSWTLDRARAKSCRYVVICRNAHNKSVEGQERHGHAFMIGIVKDVVPSTDYEGRWLVQLSGYVVGDWGPQWEGRNPVAYYKTSSFDDIDFSKLSFIQITPEGDEQGPLTIAQAKEGLSKQFGISISNIEIHIKA